LDTRPRPLAGDAEEFGLKDQGMTLPGSIGRLPQSTSRGHVFIAHDHAGHAFVKVLTENKIMDVRKLTDRAAISSRYCLGEPYPRNTANDREGCWTLIARLLSMDALTADVSMQAQQVPRHCFEVWDDERTALSAVVVQAKSRTGGE
jgi:hypothetical protein